MKGITNGFLTVFCALGLLFAAGCGDSGSTAGGTAAGGTTTGGTTAAGATSGETKSAGGASGKLDIAGSDTLLPLSKKWQEAFGAKNAGVTVTVNGGGSGRGITSLINGTCDIANSSRKAEAKEMDAAKAKGMELTETAVARDGITIIVNPANQIKSLTVQQLADIYTGKVKNWKEVGGDDMPIMTSGRDTASGTYKYFQEDILKKDAAGKLNKYRADMKAEASNNAIAGNVAQEKGGIGYIGVAYATEFTKEGKVREVPVAFKAGDAPVASTPENILSGKYPISRELYCYTNGAPKGAAKDFIDFATSDEGQKIVKDEGYVTLK